MWTWRCPLPTVSPALQLDLDRKTFSWPPATSIPVNALADLLPSIPSSRHLVIYCFLFCWILLPRGSLPTACLDAPLPWRLSSILSILQFMCCLCSVLPAAAPISCKQFFCGCAHPEECLSSSSDVTDILRSPSVAVSRVSLNSLGPPRYFWQVVSAFPQRDVSKVEQHGYCRPALAPRRRLCVRLIGCCTE